MKPASATRNGCMTTPAYNGIGHRAHGPGPTGLGTGHRSGHEARCQFGRKRDDAMGTVRAAAGALRSGGPGRNNGSRLEGHRPEPDRSTRRSRLPRWPRNKRWSTPSAGPFVIALLPESAPNHVGFSSNSVKEGAYTGTTFHRVIKNGIVQGGDPISKNPSMRALYGTGGLGMLDAEFNAEPMTAGAVAAVLLPDNRDSAGAQFFVVVTDQPALQGQYTIFGRCRRWPRCCTEDFRIRGGR